MLIFFKTLITANFGENIPAAEMNGKHAQNEHLVCHVAIYLVVSNEPLVMIIELKSLVCL